MPYRFDEFSRRILHGFESPSNDESHEQFAFLSLCFCSFFTGLILVCNQEYGTTGKVFCLFEHERVLHSHLVLSYFIVLVWWLVLHEWNGLDCYDYDLMDMFCSVLFLFCFCFCYFLLLATGKTWQLLYLFVQECLRHGIFSVIYVGAVKSG